MFAAGRRTPEISEPVKQWGSANRRRISSASNAPDNMLTVIVASANGQPTTPRQNQRFSARPGDP